MFVMILCMPKCILLVCFMVLPATGIMLSDPDDNGPDDKTNGTCPIDVNAEEDEGLPDDLDTTPDGVLHSFLKTQIKNAVDAHNEKNAAFKMRRYLKRMVKQTLANLDTHEFAFTKKVHVVEGVPLIRQHTDHPDATHSCWAYARAIALYKSGGIKDTEKYKYMTPWQTAEAIFKKQVDKVRTLRATAAAKSGKEVKSYGGDHVFVPKAGPCPTTAKLSYPKSESLSNDIICRVIGYLLDNKILITGMGHCQVTDHYSNIIGFTSSLEGTFHATTCKEKTAKGIFTNSCIWNAYCTKQQQLGSLSALMKQMHLVIAEPWCHHGGFNPTHNCVTGANNKIANGTRMVKVNKKDKTEIGDCPLDGQPVAHWKCLREVPFGFSNEKTAKNCRGKAMVYFSEEKFGSDRIYHEMPCVLGGYGFTQFMWSVSNLK